MLLRKHKNQNKIYNLLLSHLEHEKMLLDVINSVDLDENIVNVLNNILILRHKTYNRLELDNTDDYKFEIKSDEIDKELLTYFNNLETEIQNICKDLNQNNIPSIDLKLIMKFINIFKSSYLKEEIKDINYNDYSNNIIFLDKDRKYLPLSINKKKVLLTSRNFDLTIFSQDELIEILRVLDILTKDDEFDYLRTKIVEQITNNSSISFL